VGLMFGLWLLDSNGPKNEPTIPFPRASIGPIINPSPTPNPKDQLTTCRFENCGSKTMTSEECSEALCCRIGSSYVITDDSSACQKLISEFSAKRAPMRIVAPTIREDTSNSYSPTFSDLDLEQYDTRNTIDDGCQQEMSEYSVCLSEYSAKMAAYNACVIGYSDMGRSAKYICSKPYNLCSKPFGCGMF
jgi:hypothetical protein